MEVKITKEIREYSESMFFGLNLRQCVCAMLALAVAVGLYFGLKPFIGNETTSWRSQSDVSAGGTYKALSGIGTAVPIWSQTATSWLCILGAAPFAACGFFKYHGMAAEQFAWVWIKSELLYPKRLVFKTDNLYYACLKQAITEGKKSRKHQPKNTSRKRESI